MEANPLIELGLDTYRWFLGQPLVIQLILGIGLLSVGYFLWVVLRILVAALIATFRGL